jgi:hypothetical protein
MYEYWFGVVRDFQSGAVAESPPKGCRSGINATFFIDLITDVKMFTNYKIGVEIDG